MTGPEHYREAERLIEIARKQGWGFSYADGYNRNYHQDAPAMILADAQVHATLAFAAAAAPGSSQEWNDIQAAEITAVPPAPALSKLTAARPNVPGSGG